MQVYPSRPRQDGRRLPEMRHGGRGEAEKQEREAVLWLFPLPRVRFRLVEPPLGQRLPRMRRGHDDHRTEGRRGVPEMRVRPAEREPGR